jgi:serine/threonine-protein kinase
MKDSFVGQEVDGYRILEVLGQGGMGVVYKAKNMSLNRMEALKVIAPLLVQDAQFLRRFKREAQALARIHHPNIVTVYTLRHAEVGYYLTMEYVEGHTLADRLVEGRGMDWREALPIVKQLLAAFDFAHRRGIIHRDIKPRNIMLTSEQVVKVMDFGLAKFYQQHDVTRTQGVSGTLCYMSPEQVKGHQNLDQRSDIFHWA